MDGGGISGPSQLSLADALLHGFLDSGDDHQNNNCGCALEKVQQEGESQKNIIKAAVCLRG